MKMPLVRVKLVKEIPEKDCLPATMACFSADGRHGAATLIFRCEEMYSGKPPI